MTDYQSGFEWLGNHSSGWQFGEAGLLKALCERLPVSGRFAEVGAGDGDSLPVTLDFAYEKAYRFDLWEVDEKKRAKLQERYPRARICALCQSLYGMDSYADGVVVIDVDGADYWLFASLLQCDKLPAVCMVEHRDRNMGEADIQLSIASQWIGNQATWQQLELLAIGKMTPIAKTRVNSIFVRDDLCERIRNNV